MTESTHDAKRRRRPEPPLWAKLTALAIATIVAVVFAEVLVRVARPGFPGFRIPQIEHRTVPGLGYEMVPGQHGYTYASRVTINSAGFRGPELRQPNGRPLVFCVGDSMTFGVGVEDDETFTRQLERLLAAQWPGTQPEAINMGVQRYFTFQEIDVLKQQAPKLRPDIVAVIAYVNDLGVRPSEDFVRDYEKQRERAATALRNVAPTLYLFIKNIALVEFFKSHYLAWRAPESAATHALAGRIPKAHEPKWQGFEREMITFKELADTSRFEPVVIFIPARPQVEGEMPKSMYPRRLVDHSRKIGLVAIDPLAEFQRSYRAGDDPYLPWDNHMSNTGHRIVAAALAEHMRRHPPAVVRDAEARGRLTVQ
jgi:hypothetical protein